MYKFDNGSSSNGMSSSANSSESDLYMFIERGTQVKRSRSSIIKSSHEPLFDYKFQ